MGKKKRIDKQYEEDVKLLKDVLALDNLSDGNREAFEDMRVKLDDGYRLTEPQKKWAIELLDIPIYENLVSEKKVPLGRPVPTPAVLLVRPLKPPGRK